MAGVETTNDYDISAADGVTTSFTYTFFAYSADHVKVYSLLNNVETPITSGITITPNADYIGGTVTFSVAPLGAVGDILRRREVPEKQLTEFSDITRYKETAIERALNLIVMMVQQVSSKARRGVRYSEAAEDAGVNNPVIGTPLDGYSLIFDGVDGKLKAGFNAADIGNAQTYAANALASATAADASADAAAVSEANAAATLAGALPKAGGDMTGVLGVANGTAANPSVAFADDKNTGIYSRADEEINFAITGSERARIDQYGVSVGGIAPNFNGANGQVIHTHNPTAGGYSGLRITNSESGSGVTDGGFFAAVASEFFAWIYENMPLVFATNSTRRMEIKGDGTITTGNGTTVAAGYTAAGDITLPATGKIRALNTAKFWVNFNGTGTVAIRDSFNVTSITDNGTGNYTVNITNALANANFASFVTTHSNLGGGNGQTASTLIVLSFNLSGTLIDTATICAAGFGQ